MSLPQARLLQAFVQFQNKPYILLHSARNNHIEILLKESACMSNNCIEAFVAAGVYRKLLSLSSLSRREPNDLYQCTMKFTNKVARSLTEEFKCLLERCDYDMNRINVVSPSVSCVYNISLASPIYL